MTSWQKIFWPIIIIVVLAVITHWQWFFDFSIMVFGDWRMLFSETQREFSSWPQLWNTSLALGRVNIAISKYPIFFIDSLLSRVTDFTVTERIFYLWPCALAPGISMFLLLRRLTRSAIAALVGAIVYSYNSYFLFLSTAHLDLLVVYGLAPLFLLLYTKILKERKILWAVLAGLLAFVMSAYEFRAFYIVSGVTALYVLYYLLVIKRPSWRFLGRKLAWLVGPYFIMVILNLYWLLQFSRLNSAATKLLVERGLFGSDLMSLDRALALFFPLWAEGKLILFEAQNIPVYFWLLPVLAFGALLLVRKNKYLLFYGFLALVGILLTKQNDQPLADLYTWLYENFPGFGYFREGSKFYFVIALSYAALIGGLISWLWRRGSGRRGLQCLRWGLVGLIFFVMLWPARSLVTGEVGTLYEPRTVPADYEVLNKFILDQPEYFRTLWVPRESLWGTYTMNHPRVSGAVAVANEWSNLVKKDSLYAALPFKEEVAGIYSHPYTDAVLDNAAVKYVIVPLRDDENDDDFIAQYGNSREFFIDQLDQKSYLKRVALPTEEVVIYENAGFRPHIYIPEAVNFLRGQFGEFGELDREQSIYSDRAITEFPQLDARVKDLAIPVAADQKLLQDVRRAASEKIREVPLPQLRQEQDWLAYNAFLDSYQLPVPADADYGIYFREGSVIGNSHGISLSLSGETIKAESSQNNIEGLRYFNSLPLTAGPHSLKVFHQGQPLQAVDSGDIIFVREGNTAKLQRPRLEYRQVSPVKYVVNVYGATDPFPLFFAETHHDDWHLYLRPGLSADQGTAFVSTDNQNTTQNENLPAGSTLEILGAKYLDNKNHFLVNGYYNGWWINPEDLNSADLRQNADGSRDFTLVIEFGPQRGMYIAGIISASFLGIILVYLLGYRYWRNRWP